MNGHIDLPDFSNKSNIKKSANQFPKRFQPLGRKPDQIDAEFDTLGDLASAIDDDLGLGSSFDMDDIGSPLGSTELSVIDGFPSDDMSLEGDILTDGETSPVDIEQERQAELEAQALDPELYTAKTEEVEVHYNAEEVAEHLTVKIKELEVQLGDFLLDHLMAPLKQIAKVDLDERALEKMRDEVVKLVQLQSAVSMKLIGPADLISRFQALELDEELEKLELETSEEPDKVDLVAIVNNQVFSTRIGEFGTVLAEFTGAQLQ